MLPFLDNDARSKVPFHKIRCDLWGPAPVLSTKKFRFFATFVDDCTKFLWFYLLYNKSGFFAYLQIV